MTLLLVARRARDGVRLGDVLSVGPSIAGVTSVTGFRRAVSSKSSRVQASLARLVWALAVFTGACGRSSSSWSGGAGNAGDGMTAGAGTGGTGGSVNTGGDSPGGSASGGASGVGGVGGDAFAACRENTNAVTVRGDLPADFGGSTTLFAGCSDQLVETYPWPASFSERPPEAPGIQVHVLGCTSDERLRVELNLGFQSTGALAFSALVLSIDGTTVDSHRISTLNATKPPFVNWPYPVDTSEGVGAIFEGSFSSSDAADGGTGAVSGHFSVCHVANFPFPGG